MASGGDIAATTGLSTSVPIFPAKKELTEELLATIKCVKCKRYASIGPIIVTKDGGVQCGRCPGNNNEPVNEGLQALLQTLNFPCSFIGRGCATVLAWEAIAIHEEECFSKNERPLPSLSTYPTELLNKWKCDHCRKYLSVGPLYIQAGKNVCGRCSPYMNMAEIGLSRNHGLEAMLKTLQIPCIYHEKGCEFMLYWDDINDHEQICNYREFNCPSLPVGTCQELTSVQRLEEHLRENHQELIMTTQELKQRLSEDSETVRMFSWKNQTFLLMSRVKVEEGMLEFDVCYVGDGDRASSFKFLVTVYREEVCKRYSLTTTPSVVRTSASLHLDAETCATVSLDALRYQLRAGAQPLEEVTCEVNIATSSGEIVAPNKVTVDPKVKVAKCKFGCGHIGSAHLMKTQHQPYCSRRVQPSSVFGGEIPKTFKPFSFPSVSPLTNKTGLSIFGAPKS